MTKTFRPTRYPQQWWEQIYFRKTIHIVAGSRLRRITGQDHLCVNSVHSQAVGQLGDGLIVSAREENGVVQAIERPGTRFWMGVQFDPEFLLHRKPYRRLFRAFIEAANERRQSLSELPPGMLH